MNRFFTWAAALATFVFAVGCDKQGLHPYGKLTDVIDSCGANAAVYLRSTDEGTDMVLFGAPNATDVVTAAQTRCFLFGTVYRDSSTTLQYGTYELDGTGNGIFHVQAAYNFVYEPNVAVAARTGAERADFDPVIDSPMTVVSNGGRLTVDIQGASRTYRPLADVIHAIDLDAPSGGEDVYQLYNLALFFSQVRIPAFGGLGMTRYITAPGTFAGLATGFYVVSVQSLVHPHATISYRNLEDFPGIWVDGDQVTKVNISGDGPMEGVLSFEFREPGNPTQVVISGTVDYANVNVANGVGSSGYYVLAVDGHPTTWDIPISVASNVDLRNILPVEP